MDKHGQIGPKSDDNADYTLDIDHIRKLLEDGYTVRVRHAHRGSVYTLVMVGTSRSANPHFVNFTGPKDSLDDEPWVYVGNETVAGNGGFYRFMWGSYLSHDYVMEKLGIDNVTDAKGIANFLTMVLIGPVTGSRRARAS